MNAELDKFMAEKVMGWEELGFSWKDSEHNVKCDILDWHPTKDPGQAMRCAEKLSKDNTWRVEIDIVPHGFAVNIAEKTYGENYLSSRFGDELPLAICEAIVSAIKGANE